MEYTFGNFAMKMDWYYTFLQKVYLKNIEELHSEEKREIFEAFVLKVHVTWEKFVIKLLIDCLNRDSSQYAEYMGFKKLKKHLSRNQCEGILLGLGYLTFRDVSEIKAKAKKILVAQYNPFAHISNDNRDKINEFYNIRNFVVHESSVARRNLLNKVYKNRYRMRKFCPIGDFLFRKERGTATPRLGNYINVFGTCAQEMAKFLGLV